MFQEVPGGLRGAGGGPSGFQGHQARLKGSQRVPGKIQLISEEFQRSFRNILEGTKGYHEVSEAFMGGSVSIKESWGIHRVSGMHQRVLGALHADPRRFMGISEAFQ